MAFSLRHTSDMAAQIVCGHTQFSVQSLLYAFFAPSLPGPLQTSSPGPRETPYSRYCSAYLAHTDFLLTFRFLFWRRLSAVSQASFSTSPISSSAFARPASMAATPLVLSGPGRNEPSSLPHSHSTFLLRDPAWSARGPPLAATVVSGMVDSGGGSGPYAPLYTTSSSSRHHPLAGSCEFPKPALTAVCAASATIAIHGTGPPP